MAPSSKLPLDGIRVVDFSRLLPGPYCSLVLADLGAEVIKVEEPGIGDYLRVFPPLASADGQPMSAAFAALNRNKKSVTLNLRSRDDAERARKLCTTSDVVIESFRPGVMQRLGLDYASLAALHPKLIMASISGFGQTGPWRLRAGHDLNFVALSGALHRNVGRDGHPHPLAVQVADLAAGALFPATGILAALFRRERTGEGAFIDASMSDGAAALLPFAFATHAGGGLVPHPSDDILNGSVPSYNVYPTRDDRHLAVAALEPKFWIKLCEALDRADLAAAGLLTGEPGQAVWRSLAAIFRSKTRDEWVSFLAPYDCCVEPVLAVEEVADHPHHRERKLFISVALGNKQVNQVRTPLFLECQVAPTPAPSLGQHNDEIFAR